MPEGPECTRVARQLNRAVANKSLVSVNLLTGRYAKKTPIGFEEFVSTLPDTVRCVEVKGKFIYWKLDRHVIFSTLGMTGNYKITPNKYARVAFYFDDDSAVYYCDQRNFGTLKFLNDDYGLNELEKKLHKLGPDMLNNPCTQKTFNEIALRRKNWSLVKFLMHQESISGVGNIYKSESLYLAGLNPARKVGSLTVPELEKLYNAICKVLSASYESGGATIRNYSDLYNNHGKYARFASNPQEMLEARWDNKVMIYGRKQDIYGNIVQRIKLDDKRTTYWTPEVQQ